MADLEQSKSKDDNLDVDGRSARLFSMLVELYISDGSPVASKRLANESGLSLSSATVRNVMADLEHQGLVVSPHTSAGKVPTAKGLRFFVDSLITVQPLENQTVERLKLELNPDLDPKLLVGQASRLLSQVTHMAGVVTLPRRDITALRQVEFLPLTGRRVLVILVVNEREVQNRVIHTDRDYDETELNQAANLINQQFAGQSLQSIRDALLHGMQADKDRMDRLMQTVIDVAGKALQEDADDDDVVVAGENMLIQHSESPDLSSMNAMFDAFSRKRDILHLLDQCLESSGVQLFIGQEAGYEVFDELSLVTSSYEVDGKVAGVLGVIGPTRMAYQRVIPVVDATARLLGASLSS